MFSLDEISGNDIAMPKSGLKDCGGWWVGVESDFSVKPPELNKMVTVLEMLKDL